jgi:rfaE bifunctional protein kinase chain/domain
VLQLLSKVKTVGEVRALVGARPRGRKVIMCHGVFDVVHPGHIRHLLYAKSKADILVASLTSDRHIDKGPYRPHVPQDLRATNLAALEMVDYVVIDDSPPEQQPISSINLIQPDYFAKGFEYAGNKPASNTALEAAAVEAYGGEMLFTPGDVVYSSSKLIELSPPDLKYAKLASLMEQACLTFDDLRDTIARMRHCTVHVVGDAIVDTITYCNTIGASSKTPTLSVQIERVEDFVGGAAVVAKHVKAAGAKAKLSTVVGDDRLGKFVLDDLQAAHVRVHPCIDRARVTTNKSAIVAGGYRLLKVDSVDNRAISQRVLRELCEDLVESDCDAAVYSDFRHGIFNSYSTARLLAAPHNECFRAADSQVASRWGCILDFKGVDLITPNEREARFALGDPDSGVRALAWNLFEKAQCKSLIMKLGSRGVLGKGNGDGFSIDAFSDKCQDPVGAGDALLAYATLSMVVQGDIVRAAILGSLAAGVACEREGNVPVAAAEVRRKIDAVESSLWGR